MTSTHTPGPWTLGDEDSPLLLSSDNAYVAQVLSRDEKGALRPSYAADAALIAAAPDLLAALKLLEQEGDWQGTSWAIPAAAWRAARAAIAKATATAGAQP